MRRIRALPAALLLLSVAALGAGPGAVAPFEDPGGFVSSGGDRHAVLAGLRAKGIEPARRCSDAVFVRRVYLDVIGTLPDRRGGAALPRRPVRPTSAPQLIDPLLEREEFADYWAMKWCDLLRVKAEFPINLWPNAVQAYHRWIRTRIKENMPYDRFVREMLTSSGSNFRVPAGELLPRRAEPRARRPRPGRGA